MITLDNRTLAEVLLSSAITLEVVGGTKRARNRSEHKTFPKRIVFDLSTMMNYFVINNKKIINMSNGVMIESTPAILDELTNTLNVSGAHVSTQTNQPFEFITIDEITRSVNVFSSYYIDRFVNSEKQLVGEMVMDYFKLWYVGKVGKGKNSAQNHHEQFKTFSLRETDYLRHKYMPLAISPNNMKPISDAIQYAINNSVLRDYIKTDIGYSISASRVEGSRMYWIPRIVAKEYLEETDDFKVFSEDILRKVLTNAGLLGSPAVEHEKEISNSIFTKEDIKKTTDDFILNKVYQDEDTDNPSLFSNEIKPLAIKAKEVELQSSISFDIDEVDNLIPDNIGEISLDY